MRFHRKPKVESVAVPVTVYQAMLASVDPEKIRSMVEKALMEHDRDLLDALGC